MERRMGQAHPEATRCRKDSLGTQAIRQERTGRRARHMETLFQMGIPPVILMAAAIRKEIQAEILSAFLITITMAQEELLRLLRVGTSEQMLKYFQEVFQEVMEKERLTETRQIIPTAMEIIMAGQIPTLRPTEQRNPGDRETVIRNPRLIRQAVGMAEATVKFLLDHLKGL